MQSWVNLIVNLATIDDVSELALMRAIKIAMDFTVLSKYSASNLFFEFLIGDKVIMPALDLPNSGASRCIANTQLKSVWIAREQLRYDCSLNMDGWVPFLLLNTHWSRAACRSSGLSDGWRT